MKLFTSARRRVVLPLAFAMLAAPLAAGTATADSTQQMRYVALGDSFAAGIGIPDQIGTPSGCQRSGRNYPNLLASKLGAASFTDVTCGGATTVNLTRPQTVTGGANAPQLDAVTSDTTLVTLEMGGNDIGFGDILTTCATKSLGEPDGSPCKTHYGAGGTDQLAVNIAQTAPKIAQSVKAIRAKAPKARILLLGYPAILPEYGSGCWPFVPVAFGDTPYLRSTQKALNKMIADQARANSAEYVDVYTPSIWHDACQPWNRWVEGLNLQTPFHPNVAGHQGMAAAVENALG